MPSIDVNWERGSGCVCARRIRVMTLSQLLSVQSRGIAFRVCGSPGSLLGRAMGSSLCTSPTNDLPFSCLIMAEDTSITHVSIFSWSIEGNHKPVISMTFDLPPPPLEQVCARCGGERAGHCAIRLGPLRPGCVVARMAEWGSAARQREPAEAKST